MSNDPDLINALLTEQPTRKTSGQVFGGGRFDTGLARPPVVVSSTRPSSKHRDSSDPASTNHTAGFQLARRGDGVVVMPGILTTGFGTSISVSGADGSTAHSADAGDVVYIEISFDEFGEPDEAEIQVGSFPSSSVEFSEESGPTGDYFLQTKAYHYLGLCTESGITKGSPGNVVLTAMIVDGKFAYVPVKG